MPRHFDIIRRVEGQLLNERVRCINDTIDINEAKWDTCINQLACVLDSDTFNDC